MKILLIANRFFGYANRVSDALCNLGHKVNLFFIYSPTYIERIGKKIYGKKTNSLDYYDRAINNFNEENYDLIFVFGGGCPKSFLDDLKNTYPTKFVLYMSADLASYKFSSEYLAIFDRIFTYSKIDALEHGFIYRPWFYSDTSDAEKIYDVSFVGSIHDNRYPYLSCLNECNDLRSNIYVYADFLTFLNSFKKWNNLFGSIHFKGLNYNSYINLLGMSRATLDIPDFGQKNITTRPIEALGCNTKIITTNNNIAEYDFYNMENVKIINEPDDILKLKDWISQPYRQLDDGILARYNILNWCNEILAQI